MDDQERPQEPGSEADDAGRPEGPGAGPRTANLAAVAGAVVLIGLVAFAVHRMRGAEPPAENAAGAPAPGATPAPGTPITARLPYHLTPEASIVAENYRCVCGCPDRLSVCTCDKPSGSNEMKAFLQGLVNDKKTRAEIDAAMVAKYGPEVLLSNPAPQASPVSSPAPSRPARRRSAPRR